MLNNWYTEGPYNSEAFTPEEVEKGSHLELLKTLFKLNDRLDNGHYDIHITSDGYCLIIEWCQVHPDFGPNGFVFVNENQRIVTEFSFPDNHYESFDSKEEYEERLKEWLEQNPGWTQSEYGNWYKKDDEKNEDAILKKYFNPSND